jgi:16S rRNA (cytosine1402-N4)-methyltransferase
VTLLLDMTRAHVPVLAGELLELLEPRAGCLAIDCTFGSGGHARLVAERIGAAGELICIDRDPQAELEFAAFSDEVPCATRFIRGNYAGVLPTLFDEGLRADLLYMDLGVSSLQVDTRERGFSYSYDAPLDMRMDPAGGIEARTIVNEWPEQRLSSIFRQYGEERYSRRIAREIVLRRERAPLETTTDLVETIKRAVPVPAQFGSGHPARRIFRAIRIAVNDEIDSLERALPEAWRLLRPHGRIAAISFQSLEDRLVKRFLVDRARECICPPEIPVCVCGGEPEAELLTRRPLGPTPEELAENPRAHSAKLRAALKLREDGRIVGPRIGEAPR